MSPTAHAAALLIGREAELAGSRAARRPRRRPARAARRGRRRDRQDRGLALRARGRRGAGLPRAALRGRAGGGAAVVRGPGRPGGRVADELLDELPAPQREALEIALLRRATPGARRIRPRSASACARCSSAPPRRAGGGGGRRRAVARRGDRAGAGVRGPPPRRPPGRRARHGARAEREPDPLGLERGLGPGACSRVRVGPLGLDRCGPDRVAARPRVPAAGALRSPRRRRQPAVRARDRPCARPGAGARGGRAAARAREPARDRRRRIAGLEPGGAGRAAVAAALSHPTVELVEQAASAAGLVARRRAGCWASRATAGLRPPAVRVGGLRGGRERAPARAARVAGRARRRAEERVRHRALAAAGPTRGRVGARGRRRVGARPRRWETAGELLEQARALTPAARPYAARKRGVRAAEHHIHAGDRPRARALLETILEDAPPGPTRSDALRLLAEIRYNEDGFADALALLEEALRARARAVAGGRDRARPLLRPLQPPRRHRRRRRARRSRARPRRPRPQPTLLGEALACAR